MNNARLKLYFALWLISGFIVIAILCNNLRKSLENSYETLGASAFNRAYIILSEKINSYVYGLQGMAGVYIVTKYAPTPKQIRDYAQFRNFFSNFPGLLGYGFIRRIPNAEITHYQNAKQSFDKSFRISTISLPSGEDRMIIEAIEPIEQNKQAIGLDISSEKNRYHAAISAVDSGKPTLTDMVRLVQLKQYSDGFLFLLPLYKTPYTPLDHNERRKSIIGWVYAPLLLTGIENYLKSTINQSLSLTVYNQKQDGGTERLFSIGSKLTPTYERILAVGQKSWIVKGAFDDEGSKDLISYLPFFIFISLILAFTGVSILMRYLIVSHTTSNH